MVTRTLGRWVASGAMLVVSGCGVGGGGGGAPPPTGPTVALTADDFTVESGHTDSLRAVSWTVAGATGNVTVTLGDASSVSAVEGRDYTRLGTGPTGSISVDLKGGANDIYVYDGTGTEIGHKTATGSCASGSTWSGYQVCAPDAGWKYDEFALVIYADNCAKVGWLDLTSPDSDKVKELANKSNHHEQTAAHGELDCSLALGALPIAANDSLTTLPDGMLLASFVTPNDGNARRWFPINPVTKEVLPEWTGAVPSNTLQSTGYGTFGDTPYASFDVGLKGMYADLGGGTLFFTNNDDQRIRYTTDGFNNSTVVSDRSSINQGSFKFLVQVPAK